MMAVEEAKLPVYDNRVKEIIRSLTEGKSRDDIVKRFDYSNWRSADMYMRRKGFVWDQNRQNYTPAATNSVSLPKGSTSTAPPKVFVVMSLFEDGETDPRSVAKRVGFKDHREMAEYMRSKGYVWSTGDNNYVEFAGEIVGGSMDENSSKLREGKVFSLPTANAGSSEVMDLADYLPLLELLERNKEQLIDLLMPALEDGTVPHYAVPGNVKSKSVYLSADLSNLMGYYCERRNLTQKQAYEAAMIEYLRRYGFKREVDSLLKKA